MIRARKLCKQFDHIAAVTDADLCLDPGDILALLGPDGAGKTTLIRMLCGLVNPDSGEFKVLGYEQAQIEHARIHMGYMPQRFSLYDDLRVMENLSFFGAMYEVENRLLVRRAEEILDITGLLAYKNRLTADLSGGMKQKLALTCALINRPRLLLLDEPTHGVDPESRQDFWKILYRLNREGTSILVSTAYMDEAELCNQVVIINQGRIMIRGTPGKIKEGFPCTVWEVKISSRDPDFFKDLEGLQGDSFYGDRYRLMMAPNWPEACAIMKYISRRGMKDTGNLKRVHPTMEDVFLFYEGERGL